MKKTIALLLALVLALGCFAGCGNETEAPADSSEAPATDAPVVTEDPGPSKYDLAYAKYDPKTVVMTINGEDVLWENYFCWIYSVAMQLEASYGVTDWATEIDAGYTYQDYILEYASAMVTQYILIAQNADAMNVQLNEDQIAALESALQEDADANTNGDIEAFTQQLADLFITVDYYNFTNEMSLKFYQIFEDTYGEQGSKVSDDDVLAYFADKEYMNAKHILFKTVDDAGTALDEAAVAEKKALAEDTVAQLEACATQEEKVALFDKIMNEKSEDPGSKANPDGYYFLPGEMVPSFEEAAKALAEGEFSGIVESDYGFHILYRPEVDPDAVVSSDSSGNPVTLRYLVATGLFDVQTAEWTESMEVSYSEGFEQLDLNKLFAAE